MIYQWKAPVCMATIWCLIVSFAAILCAGEAGSAFFPDRFYYLNIYGLWGLCNNAYHSSWQDAIDDVSVMTDPIELSFRFEQNNALGASIEVGVTSMDSGFHGAMELLYFASEESSHRSHNSSSTATTESRMIGAFFNLEYDFWPIYVVSPYLGMGFGLVHLDVEGVYHERAQQEISSVSYDILYDGTFFDLTSVRFGYQFKVGMYLVNKYPAMLGIGYRFLGAAKLSKVLPSDILSRLSVVSESSNGRVITEKDSELTIDTLQYQNHILEVGLRFDF